MKKLRLFDSLKFVVAAIVCTFILNVAHADTTINSVIAYGKTEQSATPTPTAPVPIMTNNGVLKVSPNLFNRDTVGIAGGAISSANGKNTSSASRCRTIGYVPVNPNTTYTVSAVIDGYTGSSSSGVFVLEYTADSGDFESNYTGTSSGWKNPNGYTFTTGSTTHGIRFVFAYSSSGEISPSDITNIRLEEGSTATTGIYVDGLTEKIRDSAGHTATARMLLGLNDEYRDEQNINTGAITRKVGVKVLDGTEDWVVVSGADYFRLDGMFEDTIPYASDNPAIVCSHFVGRQPKTAASGMNDKDIKLGYTSTYNRLYLKYYNMTSADDLKQWLAEQYANGTPVIVVYPLKASAQTTESVATQQMTTAPVRQTAGSILGMPIEVVFGDGTREWVRDMITIATTRYNEESFAPVKTDLSAAVNAVEYVVSNTMSQAQAIDQIATTKQTRPDETCPVGKNCLLVEDENGTPHWYVIAGADEANPSTNP